MKMDDVNQILIKKFFYFCGYNYFKIFETCFTYKCDHFKINELCNAIGMIYILIFLFVIILFFIVKNIIEKIFNFVIKLIKDL